MFQDDLLRGKVALVVGGSSESGPAVCETLARYGADVALTYHSRREKAQQVAQRCREVGSRRAEICQFDLLEMPAIQALIPFVTTAMRGLDLLVNLGGPPPVYTHLRDLAESDYDRMMLGHVKGPFFLAREAALYMQEHGGVIINVSATSSIKYGHSAYGLAKACENEMTKFLAHAFAPHVRVITLVPGLIDIEETDAKMRQDRAGQSPLHRIVTPEEIGLLCVAAASPAFASVTGDRILADGGFWLTHG